MISFDDFLKVDMRVGKILNAREFPQARNPSYILTIDFGPGIGIKKSSAQITQNYTCTNLTGKLIIGVVNFPAKQIGSMMSEVLVLGVKDEQGNIRLLSVEEGSVIGERVY